MDNGKRSGSESYARLGRRIILSLIALIAIAGCSKKDDCCCSGKPVPTAVLERAKDPVCGMWVEKTLVAIKADFDNADYYFCAEDCKQQFLKNQTRFTTKCNCKSYKHDCKCEHCSGKRVPCDCK